jgi:hypothetical protein
VTDPPHENGPQELASDLVDALEADLRRIAALADPPPARVHHAALAAFATRRIDEELAELVRDSDLAPAGDLRAEDDVRLLSFEHLGVSVELQVQHGRRTSVHGVVTGATGDVVLELLGERLTAGIDDDGWFALADVPGGTARLHVTAVDGTAVVTAWFHL